MAGHAVEGVVQAEAAVHFNDGPPEDIDVTPCIVASQGGVVEGEAGLDVIEGMPGPAGPSKQHFGNVDGYHKVSPAWKQSVQKKLCPQVGQETRWPILLFGPLRVSPYGGLGHWIFMG